MWFLQVVRSFFYTLDSTLFNFIPRVYDLLIEISRTSILTQGQIKTFADRIQLLLGIFMLFKVTFSLITYIINPDEFSDKGKGFGKLWQNITVSLIILILTPYAFNLAYELQAMVLEDNVLAGLVFGQQDDQGNYLSSTGEKMAYTIMEPFFSPNVSLPNLYVCATMYETNPDSGVRTFNSECKAALKEMFGGGSNSSTTYVDNYAAGVENSNLGLMFRLDIAKKTVVDSSTSKEDFIIDYSVPVTTVVAVIVLLLLVTFCMDIALRSIKLSFLQLIAPIPIISYIDPKSGKEGLFKKWYQMCFSTYLSLFVRLLALYLAIYIISKVNSMTDVITGASVTNGFVKIFIIIGVLMFAKQLPKILEGFGIKLDGDGKFTLNPFKKLDDSIIGGDKLGIGKKTLGGAKGLATGLAIGAVGTATGAGAGRFLSGAFGGLSSGMSGKKAGEIRKDQVAANARMREAIANGSTFWGRRGAQFSNFIGSPGEVGRLEAEAKRIENSIKPLEEEVNAMKKVSSAKSDMKNRAKDQLYNAKFDTRTAGGAQYANIQKSLLEAKYKKEAMEENLKNKLDRGLISQTQYAQSMATATAAFNQVENKALEDYSDWSIRNSGAAGVDAAIVGIKEKTNATIRSSEIFARQGISEIVDFGTVKSNDGKAQGRITEIEVNEGLNQLRQQQSDLKNSDRYGAAQANKNAVK